MLKVTAVLSILLLYSLPLQAQNLDVSEVDVLNYQVRLEPNFEQQSISGNVAIRMCRDTSAQSISLDSGNLKITSVEGQDVTSFKQDQKKTIISLRPSQAQTTTITLHYEGKPKRGLLFFDQTQKLYTVYFTSEWMVCHSAPRDKATLYLDLILPKGVVNIASGVLKDSISLRDKIQYSWRQDYETPAYTYGFTVGSFYSSEQQSGTQTLRFYSEHHPPEELQQIFQYTGDMITFFEEVSGVSFPQETYSQVLIGNHFQEMSGFSILKRSYGHMVLADSTETNLISHELAHQWWGNRITCQTWNHFWLNEGFATFMSAAYNEHRFGREKYLENIHAYQEVYQKIKNKGGDKPLVFPNWTNPSRDDRNLVYFKGAYVLHLLRLEMGEVTFWKGIKAYSQNYLGKAVTTKEFQEAMEHASGLSLESFFQKWIYGS